DGIRDGHVTGVQTCALPISIFAPAKEATAKPPAVSRAAPPSGGPKAEAGPAEKPTKPSLATSQPSPTPPISPAAIVPETSVGLRSEERRVGKECRSRWSR